MNPKDQMFMRIAREFSGASTCERGQVGCVIVKFRRIVSTGYNGAPAGLPHCQDDGVGCLVHGDSGCLRSIHAEANAISYAARAGTSIEDATLYCTHGPCLPCAQLIVASGISFVVFDKPYRLKDGLDLLRDAGVTYSELQHPYGYPHGPS